MICFYQQQTQQTEKLKLICRNMEISSLKTLRGRTKPHPSKIYKNKVFRFPLVGASLSFLYPSLPRILRVYSAFACYIKGRRLHTLGRIDPRHLVPRVILRSILTIIVRVMRSTFLVSQVS